MLRTIHRDTIPSYDRAKNCPIWVYAHEEGSRVNVDYFLTLDEAKEHRAQLDRVIEQAEAAEDIKAQAECEAAEFAAFKASRKVADDDRWIAQVAGLVERSA